MSQDHRSTSPQSFWIESTRLQSFPELNQDLDVEVAIIGGGITGITTAYSLVKEGLNVAIFDADKILNGTTGHTTAKITAQHGLIYDEFISHFGENKAKLYYEANQKALADIEERIKQLDIDCDFKKEDAYIYTNSTDYVAKLKKEADAYEKLGIDGEYIENIPLNVNHKAAVMMRNQALFHPLHYLSRLIEVIQSKGGKIYENAVAMKLEEGKSPVIKFRNGVSVSAKYVISASHFPFHDGKGYFARLFPERSYIVAGKPLNPFQGGMYISAESPSRSIRPVIINGEEMLLFGGDGHKAGQGSIESSHYEALEKFAKENYNVEKIIYRWSTQDLVTPDKIPYIGRLDPDKNVFVATGFKKWGMTTSHVAANLIKDLIMNNDDPYIELFSPSRFQTDPGLKKVIKENLNVAGQLISGKLTRPDKEMKDIEAGQGGAISIKGKRAGAYRDENGAIYVVDTTCTHMGCEVNWNSGDKTWDCPCHGSRFSYMGEVIEGPADKPLKIINPEEIDYSTS